VFLRSAGLYQAFNMPAGFVYSGLLFFALLFTPVETVLSIMFHAVSRKYENAADRFAAESIGEPSALADSLKKLSAANLSNLTPHPFFVALYYSHPPLAQRLQAIGAVKPSPIPS
jgi:STE24 endopeptidase